MGICVFKDPDEIFVYLAGVGFGFCWAQSNILYTYTAEYYPTKIRNTALGNLCACARLAGIISPMAATMLAE